MISIRLCTLFSALRPRRALIFENLALRHQLDVLQRNTNRLRLTNRDRTLWVILSRVWADWRKPLTLVQPETVIRWHRMGFRLYWRWKSRPKLSGRTHKQPTQALPDLNRPFTPWLRPADRHVPDTLMTALLVIVNRVLGDRSDERSSSQKGPLVEPLRLD